MNVKELELAGVFEITPTVFEDDRGYFFESYQLDRFVGIGIDEPFVQDNESYSTKGCLRGMHIQIGEYAQSKLVRVGVGRVFDVVVDVRPESDTYGKWCGVTLDSDKKNMLYVPKGFLHGFYALSDTASLLYKCSAVYHPGSERSVVWNDPDIGIDWPLESDPLISEKDLGACPLKDSGL